MKLRWTLRARRDLEEIGIYISRDSPDAARRWIERLRDRTRKAAQAPRAGRVVPEVEREDVREVFLRSYRIVYCVGRDFMEVLTVFEGHRLLRREDIPEPEE
jgi:toxin ParE1/3/4